LTLVEIGRKRGRREDEREAANKPPQRMKNIFEHAASLAKRPAALARGVASQSCGHTTTVPHSIRRTEVRLWGQTGKKMLMLSSSHFYEADLRVASSVRPEMNFVFSGPL